MEYDKPPQRGRMKKLQELQKRYREFDLYRKFQAKTLHIGLLGNIYTASDSAHVEGDLSSVTRTIAKTLDNLGFRVTLFDMNQRDENIVQLIRNPVDIVFNVCERINNNSLLEPHAAALLDILQIPYTGSNPQTLALSIDKIRVKKLLTYHGVPTPSFDYFYSMDDKFEEDLRFPLIVKPANTDNSIGITNRSVVRNKKEMKRQMEEVIIGHKRPALVEEYIEGDELDISIIGNDETLEVLPLSRSIFDKMPKGLWHIFPFEAKWGEDEGEGYHGDYDHIRVERPAKLPARLTRYIKEISVHTYNILDCHDYGRVEARLDKAGNPYIIELNPNPSINKGDSTPNSAEVVGMNYEQFIHRVLELAIIRYVMNPPYFHLQVPDPGIRRKDNILKLLSLKFPDMGKVGLERILKAV